jgi:hypothetical protein
LKLDLGGNPTTLNLSLRTSDNKLAYADAIYFVGKATVVGMNGTYKAGDLVFSISEVGNTARRSFDGLVTINGKQYSLHGNRAWTRAGFTLTTPANSSVVGRGWIEWQPTAQLTRSMLKGHTGPTDRIEVQIDLVDGQYPDGIHKVLARD